MDKGGPLRQQQLGRLIEYTDDEGNLRIIAHLGHVITYPEVKTMPTPRTIYKSNHSNLRLNHNESSPLIVWIGHPVTFPRDKGEP